MNVRILGLEEAERLIADLEGGARAVSGAVVRVGTPLNYAWGIHFGRRRNGRLARRLGGAFFLTDALLDVKSSIEPTIARALPKGSEAVGQAMLALGLKVERKAKKLLQERVYGVPISRFSFRRTATGKRSKRAPRKKWTRTGNLRGSIHTVME